jgi:hypothetical protein
MPPWMFFKNIVFIFSLILFVKFNLLGAH